jgi:hypothetical protein
MNGTDFHGRVITVEKVRESAKRIESVLNGE